VTTTPIKYEGQSASVELAYLAGKELEPPLEFVRGEVVDVPDEIAAALLEQDTFTKVEKADKTEAKQAAKPRERVAADEPKE
jgi:hypothetical protein